MVSEDVRAPRSALDASLQAELRLVFATELQARLPRLVAARDGVAVDLIAVRRDAHTLCGSSAIVGEPELARLARAAETDLAPARLDALVRALQAWTP